MGGKNTCHLVWRVTPFWTAESEDLQRKVNDDNASETLTVREVDESSLGSRIYHEQLAKGWPGLAKEGTDIYKELDIEDVTRAPIKARNC